MTSTVKRVLVVEDDRDIASLLKIHLSDLGYDVDFAVDGRSGLDRALKNDYSLIVLDLMLPKLGGHEVCRSIRQRNRRVPILMLTMKSDLVDKVLGLELGADDYMTKPFSIQELVARVKALLRRAEPAEAESPEKCKTLEFGELCIDLLRRKVFLKGAEVLLTPKQFDLLSFLARSPGRPYGRLELLSYVWGYDTSGYEHTVDTHINRLRSRIESDPSNPRFILTVWGIGYRFAEKSELEHA